MEQVQTETHARNVGRSHGRSGARQGCLNAGLCFCALVLLAAAGCGSSTRHTESADASFERHFRVGVARIRATHDRSRLRRDLVRTLATVRRDAPTTRPARQAQRLALQGFEATLKGVESLLDFSENDSGNLTAATRDARRADRYLTLGADRLRAAGRMLGISVGTLNQH
jgi:hypothetical protein